jgi:hypothetical protein
MSTRPAPKSLANLKPFPKGVSGNPSGRPPAIVTRALREIAAEVAEDGPEPETQARRLARILWEASTGVRVVRREQLEAAKICLDRLEGRPHQSITVDVDDEGRRERKIASLLADSERADDPLTRSEAIALLAEEDASFEGME